MDDSAIKSTEAEVAKRVALVSKWLVLGKSRRQICEYAQEKEHWGVSESQIDRYIAKARSALSEQSSKDIAGNYALAEARYEFLYNRAVEQGNLSLAARILKDMSALQGINDSRAAEELSESAGGFYIAMAAYGEAIKAIVSPNQVSEIVKMANGLGVTLDISSISPGKHIDPDVEENLALAVEDYRLFGRGRTREELVEAGIVEQSVDQFSGLNLP